MKQHAFHLPFEFAYAPVFFGGLLGVKANFQIIVGLQNFKIVTPSQFVRQRLTILKAQIQLAHIEHIGAAKTLAILRGEVFR